MHKARSIKNLFSPSGVQELTGACRKAPTSAPSLGWAVVPTTASEASSPDISWPTSLKIAGLSPCSQAPKSCGKTFREETVVVAYIFTVYNVQVSIYFWPFSVVSNGEWIHPKVCLCVCLYLYLCLCVFWRGVTKISLILFPDWSFIKTTADKSLVRKYHFGILGLSQSLAKTPILLFWI